MCAFCFGCWRSSHDDSSEVVIYTALDEIYSRPLLEAFERDTGIRVLAQYDVESQKTVGLKNRIVHEAGSPRCDVFWNNEIVHTIRLKARGLLARYRSPSAEGIPERFRDPDGYWTGFAARARVIVYDNRRLHRDEVPTSLADFADPRYKALRKGIALPLFGTTATHFAVLHHRLGEPRFVALLKALKTNGTRIVDGNATVMRMVGAGNLDVGFTDSDDAHLGLVKHKLPLGIIAPGQDGDGVLLIPNTIALVRGAPHPENARKLLDYLLSSQVEEALARSPSAQFPLHAGASYRSDFLDLGSLRVMEADFNAAAASLERCGILVERHLRND